MGEPLEDEGWLEFREQCRRQMRRLLDRRIKYGFSAADIAAARAKRSEGHQ